MKNLTNEMKMEVLKNAGFDMDKYNLTELVVLTPKEIEAAKEVVADKQLDNKKLFRRWVTAQTFRMLECKSYNYRLRKWETGWSAYLRNNYSYSYQFTMMLEELRVLNKLENNDKAAFAERTHFFNKGVVIATCEHYVRKLTDYFNSKAVSETKSYWIGNRTYTTETTQYLHLRGIGKLSYNDFMKFIDAYKNEILLMRQAETYAELYSFLKVFINKMIKLPDDTSKCSKWVDAFKGIGAYETLKNLVLFHDVVLRGCCNKAESLAKLNSCLTVYRGEGWRFHAMLKDTIELNNFDLKKSIAAHK